MPEFIKAPLPLFTFLISSLLGLFPLLIDTWLCGDSPSYLSVVRELLSRLTSFVVLFFLVLSSMFLYKTADFHTLVLAQQGKIFWSLPSWGIFMQPLGALIFSILISLFFSGIGHYGFSSTKENDPLFGRYKHNDAMSYYVFKLADHLFYMGLLFLFVFLFLGGYSSFFTISDSLTSSNWFLLIQILSLFIKVTLTHYVHLWISFAIPTLKWRLSVKIPLTVLFPLSLCNLICTLLWLYTYKDVSL
jgi:NADH-quinone oxidoreductase subunit H